MRKGAIGEAYRDRAGKDVQQVRIIQDRDGNVLTSEESVLRTLKSTVRSR